MHASRSTSAPTWTPSARRLAWLGAWFSVAALTTACGGGGSDNGTAPGTSPSTAPSPSPGAAPSPAPGTPAAPVITAYATSVAAGAGEGVTFSVQATGAGALTYQWQREGTDLPGATSSSLQVSPVTTADSGSQWRVKVCNPSTCTTSAPATLNVAIKALEFPPAALGLSSILGIGATPDGGLFVTNADGVHRLNPGGTLANGGKPISGLATSLAVAAGEAGSAYVTHFNPGHYMGAVGRLARYVNRVSPTAEPVVVAGIPSPHPNDGIGQLVLGTDGPVSTATFLAPFAVTRDTQGNTYVTDAVEYYTPGLYMLAGSWTGCAVKKITPSGQVATLASTTPFANNAWTPPSGLFYPCSGLAVDAQGNAYFTANEHTIRKVTPSGDSSILAGAPGMFSSGFANGPGASARFNHPVGLMVDRDGNVLVADAGNNAIRKIDKSGTVSTLIDLTQVSVAGWLKPVAVAQGEGRSLWLLLAERENGYYGARRLARIPY